jgi:hypothetical protein
MIRTSLARPGRIPVWLGSGIWDDDSSIGNRSRVRRTQSFSLISNSNGEPQTFAGVDLRTQEALRQARSKKAEGIRYRAISASKASVAVTLQR